MLNELTLGDVNVGDLVLTEEGYLAPVKEITTYDEPVPTSVTHAVNLRVLGGTRVSGFKTDTIAVWG